MGQESGQKPEAGGASGGRSRQGPELGLGLSVEAVAKGGKLAKAVVAALEDNGISAAAIVAAAKHFAKNDGKKFVKKQLQIRPHGIYAEGHFGVTAERSGLDLAYHRKTGKPLGG
jgi:hypothetical protein